MELWILTILALKGKLSAAAGLLSQRVNEEVQKWDSDVFRACEKIIELNDKKRRIVNMKVLCDEVRRALTEDEYNLLRAYIVHSAAEIAAERGESKAAVYRHIRRALTRAVKALAKLGYDEAAMERDYRGMYLCSLTYAKIKRLKSKPSRSVKGAAATGLLLQPQAASGAIAAY